MTTISIRFSNSNNEPIYLQVDPWAGFYVLKKGEEIEIVAESKKGSPSFTVNENGTTRILTLWDSAELGYYVVVNGKRLDWEKYYLDSRLCSSCLKYLDSSDTSGNVCRCSQDAS